MVVADRPLSRQEEKAQDLKETIDTAIERLAHQLANGHSERYKELLKFWAKLHQYSHGNLLLIYLQRPDASRVAGYSTWKKLGRQVRKGANGIHILCPIIKEIEDEETGLLAEQCVGFRDCCVFAAEDLVDIESNPLPSMWVPLPDDAEDTYQLVKGRIETAGFVIHELRLPAGMQGAAKVDTGEILLRQGLDSRSRLMVLLHETVHALAHRDEEGRTLSREQKEFESESCSMVVCEVLGIPHPTAADYILHYGGNVDQLKASLPRIHRLTKQVMGIVLPKDERPQRQAA